MFHQASRAGTIQPPAVFINIGSGNYNGLLMIGAVPGMPSGNTLAVTWANVDPGLVYMVCNNPYMLWFHWELNGCC